MKRIGLTCLIVAIMSVTSQGAEPSKQTVKKIAEEIADATIDGDFAKIIDHTYPSVVKVLGGRNGAINVLKAALKEMEDEGLAIKAVNVADPADFYTEGDNVFVVVPTSMEMAFPEGKIRFQSYLLGISPKKGGAWKFIDGSNLQDKELAKLVLPKMPPELELPKMGEPEIITDN